MELYSRIMLNFGLLEALQPSLIVPQFPSGETFAPQPLVYGL